MNKIYFNKVFKGYSPEEVEAFIIKLNSDIQQKQVEYSDTVKRLNSEKDEITRKYEESLSQLEKLTFEISNLETDKHNLQKEIDRLSAQPDKPEEKTPAPEVSSADAGETDGDKESQLKYKQLCEQMGEKLLIADVRSQEIIQKAKAEAQEILAKAKTEADNEIMRLVAEADKRAGSIYRMISEYEKKQVFISAGLDQVRKQIAESICAVEALLSAEHKSAE